MKKLYSFLVVFQLLFVLQVGAQSINQNYVKTTEFLESVIVESDFTSSFGGWQQNGSVSYSLESDRLKVNVNSSWEGVKHYINGFRTKAGEVLRIKLIFDKGNTLANVRLYLQELDSNGNTVAWNVKDGNIQTGIHEYSHTMAANGNSIIFRIDKQNTHTNSDTYFYIDYVSLKLGGDTASVEKLENITYLDGFGKAKQQVAVKQSTNQKDIVQHIEYDEFGRTTKQYLALPTTQNTGNYINNAQSQILSYYQSNFTDQHPFAEVRYDSSPLNRKLESSAPGNTWELISNSDTDHTAKYDYDVNDYSEVRLFEIVNQPDKTFQVSNYQKGELLKNVVKNVNWSSSDGLLNTKEVFTDKNGRKVAEFSYEDDGGSVKKLSTYYVYDNTGNLRYVLPPKAFEKLFSSDVTYTPFDLTFNWTLFVDNPSTVTGSGDVNIELEYNSVLDFHRLLLDFNLSFPFVWGGSNGAYLKQGNIVSIPIDSNLPKKYLFSVYDTKNGGPSIPGDPIGTVDSGDPTKTRYEYSIQNGYLFVEFIVGTDFGSSTTPFKVNTVDTNSGSVLEGNFYNEDAIDNLAFQYKYDEFNRQIEQKVPGKGWEYMVYDQLDRPILTQDALLRQENKWLFNKYDAFGRVVYTGISTHFASQSSLQSQVDNFINASSNKSNIESRTSSTSSIGGVSINYSNNAFPNSGLETLTVNYYDNYNFTDSSKPVTPSNILGQQVSTRTKGLLTATWAKTIGSSTWAKNYTYYDKKGRVVYVHEQNHLGGYTYNKSELDFRGKLTLSETDHKRSSSPSANLKIVDRFEYDHVERPKKHFQKINTQAEELIAENLYNELGQLETKSLGDGLQDIDYTYNIRGWLSKVNDVNNLGLDMFAYTLKYNDAIEGTASVGNQYNGNIRQIIWKSAKNNLKKSYAFEYDKLNRFSKSIYRENSSLTGGAGRFETYNLSYDANGNIQGLARKNQTNTIIDNLDYTYDNGNQLLAINDTSNSTDGFNNGTTGTSTGDYDYDVNGNLIKDLNKNITNIEYNHLDLVTRVTFGDGKKIEFTYDAAGTKLQMKNIPLFGGTTTIDYIGGFQYTNTQLQFFPTAEGYAYKDGSTFKYVYQIKDHLGNNRISFSDIDNSGAINPINEIFSNTDYYVMGLTHNGEFISSAGSNYNYKLQGKEELDFGNYNMYDFGSRMYDASVGRWFNTDPQNQFGSPYLAMGNNPVMVIDPDGELAWFVPIIAGAVIGGANTAIQNPRADFGDILTGAGIGGLSGAVSYGIGELTSGITSFGTKSLVSAGLHGVSQGSFSFAQGGDFFTGAGIGVGTSFLSSLTSDWRPGAQIGVSALSGGIISEITGGDFTEGFTGGLVISWFNHAAHQTEYRLTKARLKRALRSLGLCISCSDQEVGLAFELLVAKYFTDEGLTVLPGGNLPEHTILGGTVPDFLVGLEGNVTGTYAFTGMIEAKAMNEGRYLSASSNNGQILKQQLLLRNIVDFHSMGGRGVYYLATTAGVKVSPSVKTTVTFFGNDYQRLTPYFSGKLGSLDITFKATSR
ncbi:hypothetical protein DIS18_05385 [Algibacter marinivivus]|uniref:DUF6443 domain-containing protein n=1 Tax=Algibacter marinivivus TaxID=2100723 RepID=A0A2U2X893_9FLAO|nr:DUF6443 domain-containing protein [Algibacter marinivivus]PWH83981.1 hypothetical protein DIS18_05385 [Algibacter marinivivus]